MSSPVCKARYIHSVKILMITSYYQSIAVFQITTIVLYRKRVGESNGNRFDSGVFFSHSIREYNVFGKVIVFLFQQKKTQIVLS